MNKIKIFLNEYAVNIFILIVMTMCVGLFLWLFVYMVNTSDARNSKLLELEKDTCYKKCIKDPLYVKNNKDCFKMCYFYSLYREQELEIKARCENTEDKK